MLILIFWSMVFTPTFSIHLFDISRHKTSGNTGTPAFVTSYISDGNISYALEISYVKPMKDNVHSYAGFFTVSNTTQCKSNLFFWFFPSENESSAPVVLWLQGHPGVSSLVGVFEESGPFYVKPKRGLKLRKYSWTKTLNVLYIDNPVGSGFSFVNNDVADCYAKNEDDIANNLLIAITQFFILFPDFQQNDFFISGASYAGKYAPSLALYIDKYNKQNNGNTLKINLKGISIGNGFCDPEHLLSYGNYLYQIGLLDVNGLATFQNSEKTILKNIKSQQYDQAFNNFDKLINGDLTPYKTLFNNLTGLNSYFNYWLGDSASSYGDLAKFVQSDLARRAIHVGDYTYHTDFSKVEKFILNDIMQSVKPLIESLLNKKYRVLIYSGQMDIIVPYPLTEEFIKSLNWAGKSKYVVAKRQFFIVEKSIAGYFKQADNLIEVMIRDAGHKVTKDQPLWALEMITRFTYNKPFKFKLKDVQTLS